tara:strand:+ start:24 stop:347 length:324 start_codon:yes stop_codon:yes gene_type:complete
MIDIDKYEGHTPGPWEAPHEILVSGLNHIGPLSNGQEEVNEVDAQLIADAPLLLAEVKRLRRAFLIATGHIGWGHHLGHDDLRHVLVSEGIDDDSLPWADGEWGEEE